MTFEVVAEIEPPSRDCFALVDAQLDSLGAIASTFLVPDNHTGRATVSSLVLAGDIARRGRHAIACLNARDRNLLGLRRDLLTARYLGIEHLLLVNGDRPEVGARADGLTTRTMVEECAASGLHHSVTTRLGPLPEWKRRADRLFVQVAWCLDDLFAWRDTVRFDGPVVAGVMVLPSAAMARRLGERVPELRVPDALIDALERDPVAGVHLAAAAVDAIRCSGAFAGVHLVAGARHRETADALTRTPTRTVR